MDLEFKIFQPQVSVLRSNQKKKSSIMANPNHPILTFFSGDRGWKFRLNETGSTVDTPKKSKGIWILKPQIGAVERCRFKQHQWFSKTSDSITCIPHTV